MQNKRIGIFAAAGVLFCVAVAAQAGTLTLRATGPDGKALKYAPDIYICDLNYNPLAVYSSAEPSKTFTNLPDEPLIFCVRLDVPGFGTLNFMTCNKGMGFMPNGQTLDVLYETARHRYSVSENIRREAEEGGCKFSPAATSDLVAAKALLEAAEAAEAGGNARAECALKSLEKSGPASEQVLLERGRWKLDREGGLRPGKLVSIFGMYEDREGQKWRDAVDPLFNCVVENWHWSWIMKPGGGLDWQSGKVGQEATIQRMTALGKAIRGAAGMWLNAWPKWNGKPTVEKIREMQSSYAREIAKRYPEVEYWQIVSEATGSWDNLGILQPEDLVSLTRSVSEASAAGNPRAKRGVNSVLVWGENVPGNLGKNPTTIAPFAFHQMLNDCGIPYEFTVIQVYFSGWDVFEVDQMLEVFKKLGKPIHIESDCASGMGPMPGCRHFPEGHPGQRFYTWRRPWDEALQAEWLEKMFTICLSKDYVTEWNWWDLADYQDCYYPWGGILDKDYKPKKAYHKLEELMARWGGKLPGLARTREIQGSEKTK